MEVGYFMVYAYNFKRCVNITQINELTSSVEPSLLLSEDFKAYSKLKVENQYYNK